MDQRKTAASGGTTSCSELFIAAKTEGYINVRPTIFWKCKSSAARLHLHVVQLQYVRLKKKFKARFALALCAIPTDICRVFKSAEYLRNVSVL